MIFPYSDEARRPPLWASRQFSSKVSGMMESSSRIIGVDGTVGDFIFSANQRTRWNNKRQVERT